MQTYSDSPNIFVSGKGLALCTVVLLAVAALAKLASIGVSAAQLVLASNYPETAAAALGPGGADVTEMPGGNFQVIVLLLYSTVTIFGLIAYIATGVVFLIWEHRAYKNLPPLGVPRPDFSSGWVVGSWFVPFLNLVRPYQIVKYIWDKSDPETVSVGGGYYDTGGNFTLKAWWGIWLASNLVDRFLSRIYRNAEKLEDHVAAGWADIFSSGLLIIAACFAIAVVRDITSRQEERRKRLMDASQQQLWSAGASPN
jgi:Domain of unknown function (DUF4328)